MSAFATPGIVLRVLVVDDDRDVRLLVRLNLEVGGMFEVVGEAGHGVEAVRLAHDLQPDVVLLDLEMPVMGGLEAIPIIRRCAPAARIVVLSGSEAREAARARGAHAYLSKAFDTGSLAAEVASLLSTGPP